MRQWILLRGLTRETAHWGGLVADLQQALPDIAQIPAFALALPHASLERRAHLRMLDGHVHAGGHQRAQLFQRAAIGVVVGPGRGGQHLQHTDHLVAEAQRRHQHRAQAHRAAGFAIDAGIVLAVVAAQHADLAKIGFEQVHQVEGERVAVVEYA